jgi:hypothetical protein
MAEPQVRRTAVMPTFGAEVLGIGGNGEHRFRRGLEQKRADDGLVLVGDGPDLGGEREDSALRSSIHARAWLPWHFGQWRLRQLQ